MLCTGCPRGKACCYVLEQVLVIQPYPQRSQFQFSASRVRKNSRCTDQFPPSGKLYAFIMLLQGLKITSGEASLIIPPLVSIQQQCQEARHLHINIKRVKFFIQIGMWGLGHTLHLARWSRDQLHLLLGERHGAQAPGYPVNNLSGRWRGCSTAAETASHQENLLGRSTSEKRHFIIFNCFHCLSNSPYHKKVLNSDQSIGWTGFLPFWYCLVVEFQVLLRILRQQLWDFFKASFPKAGYLLCSATMTDAAVIDIKSSRKRGESIVFI